MALLVRRNNANTGYVEVGPENPLPVERSTPSPSYVSGYTWDDQESITVSTTAIRLTTSRTAGHALAHITVETQAVRYWLASVAGPSATVGHPLEAGDILDLESSEELEGIVFIRRDAADATLRVSYGNYKKS